MVSRNADDLLLALSPQDDSRQGRSQIQISSMFRAKDAGPAWAAFHRLTYACEVSEWSAVRRSGHRVLEAEAEWL